MLTLSLLCACKCWYINYTNLLECACMCARTHTHPHTLTHTHPPVLPLSCRHSLMPGIALGLAPPLTPPPQPWVCREGLTLDQTDSYPRVCYEHRICRKNDTLHEILCSILINERKRHCRLFKTWQIILACGSDLNYFVWWLLIVGLGEHRQNCLMITPAPLFEVPVDHQRVVTHPWNQQLARFFHKRLCIVSVKLTSVAKHE